MFFVETILIVVTSLDNKNNWPLQPVGEDYKRGQNGQWSEILDKCTDISSNLTPVGFWLFPFVLETASVAILVSQAKTYTATY